MLLEEAMREKSKISHFQSEGGSKKFEDWGGIKKFEDWGVTDLGRGYFCYGSALKMKMKYCACTEDEILAAVQRNLVSLVIFNTYLF